MKKNVFFVNRGSGSVGGRRWLVGWGVRQTGKKESKESKEFKEGLGI